jgi:Transglutaminase-like superfamily
MDNRCATFFDRFRRLSRHDLFLLFEAIFWLAIARVAIALLPFRYVGLLASHPICHEVPGQAVDKVLRIRWAVMTAGVRVPWRALCFQQGLAAQLMLRRRSIPSVLYYGAAQDERLGLRAHVWVRYLDVDVMGCELAHCFAVLASFPSWEPTRRSLDSDYQRAREPQKQQRDQRRYHGG